MRCWRQTAAPALEGCCVPGLRWTPTGGVGTRGPPPGRGMAERRTPSIQLRSLTLFRFGRAAFAFVVLLKTFYGSNCSAV